MRLRWADGSARWNRPRIHLHIFGLMRYECVSCVREREGGRTYPRENGSCGVVEHLWLRRWRRRLAGSNNELSALAYVSSLINLQIQRITSYRDSPRDASQQMSKQSSSAPKTTAANQYCHDPHYLCIQLCSSSRTTKRKWMALQHLRWGVRLLPPWRIVPPGGVLRRNPCCCSIVSSE